MQQRHLRTEQALRDKLTGVYNRAALLESASHYMNRAARTGEPLALVVMDLDRFHELNNKFGHIGGDLAPGQLWPTSCGVPHAAPTWRPGTEATSLCCCWLKRRPKARKW